MPQAQIQSVHTRPMMRRASPGRAIVSLALLALAVVIPATAANGAATPSSAHGTARLSRSLAVHDETTMHLVRAVGEALYEEGTATGTLPGTAKVQLHINAAKGSASATFTFFLRGGTLSGHSSGKASGGHNGWESFSGRMTLNRGTGKYAHASGSGNMYGAIYRRTDKLVVQDIGTLHY